MVTEPTNTAFFLCGVIGSLGAIASAHNWSNGWDTNVHADHGVGVRTRWNMRLLVCNLGMVLVVASHPVPAAPAERWELGVSVAAPWLLTVAALLVSKGELWRRIAEADGGMARIWAGKHNRLQLKELTHRGWAYASLVVTSLLVSAAVLWANVPGQA